MGRDLVARWDRIRLLHYRWETDYRRVAKLVRAYKTLSVARSLHNSLWRSTKYYFFVSRFLSFKLKRTLYVRLHTYYISFFSTFWPAHIIMVHLISKLNIIRSKTWKLIKSNLVCASMNINIIFSSPIKVNYHEERQIETIFSTPVVTSSTPKKRPARLEPLIEEIESSDNTPSYEYKEVCII